MKRSNLTSRQCAWCEQYSRGEINCAECGVAFPTILHEDLPKPAPRDRYSDAERAAFAQLDPITATMGGR